MTTTPAIILNARAFGENAALVSCFSQEFGRIKGLVRGARKKAAVLQPGNIVSLSRYRRLETQLGSLSIELETPIAAQYMHCPLKLDTLAALCELLENTLEMDDPHPAFYAETILFLENLNAKGLWERLGLYEFKLLLEMGYGLSVVRENAVLEHEGEALAYVSPRSGRAVGALTGAPYREKLLRLPALFGGESDDFLDVFRLTGHFLNKALHGRSTKAREHLIARGRALNFEEQ